MQLIPSLDDQRRQISMGLTNAYWINGRVGKVIPELQDSNKKIFFMSEMPCNGLSKRLFSVCLNWIFHLKHFKPELCTVNEQPIYQAINLVSVSHIRIHWRGREGGEQKGSYHIVILIRSTPMVLWQKGIPVFIGEADFLFGVWAEDFLILNSKSPLPII